MAGYGGLKDPSSRGTIDAVIELRMWEYYYRYDRMWDLSTPGTGMRNGWNHEIARIGVEKKKMGRLVSEYRRSA